MGGGTQSGRTGQSGADPVDIGDGQPPIGTVVDQGELIAVDIEVGPLAAGSFDALDDQARVSMYAMGLSTLASAMKAGSTDGSESGAGANSADATNSSADATSDGAAVGENALTSPVGTATAMAQIALGAQGDTRVEYERLMGMSADEAANQFSASWGLWDRWEGDVSKVAGGKVADTPLVGRSMRMVFDDQFTPNPTWKDAVTSQWKTDVTDLDLQSPSAQEDLDTWVNEHSGGMIDKSGIRLNELSRMVGQNAIVFSAPWAQPFDEKDTRRMEFHTTAGPVKLVDMMVAKNEFQGMEDEQWTAVTLPYQGEDLALHLLMPLEGTTVSPTSVHDALQALSQTAADEVEVSVPKVNFTSSVSLLDVVTDMGAPEGLAEGDYSGFGSSADSGPALNLQQFVQQGHLIIKEEGTVAAVVTEHATGDTALPPPPMLTFNRPYLAIISDTQTGTPLFMAWIGDPSALAG